MRLQAFLYCIVYGLGYILASPFAVFGLTYYVIPDRKIDLKEWWHDLPNIPLKFSLRTLRRLSPLPLERVGNAVWLFGIGVFFLVDAPFVLFHQNLVYLSGQVGGFRIDLKDLYNDLRAPYVGWGYGDKSKEAK